jgi:iron complex outermembrane receptor protein
MAIRRLSALSAAAAISLTTAPFITHAETEYEGLEEIVVTAQKREQDYLEVPVSVSTVTGEVLDIIQADNFQDLEQVSASITHTQSHGMRGNGVLIRGIGTTAFQSGVEPTVSTVVDGVVLGRTGSFLNDLVDIERVEVLRGPQGTLFGKNASGGLVNVVTARPTDVFEGMLRLTATDDDQQIVEGTVSGSLSDTVNGRLSVYWKEFDGFIENRFTGETINGDESQGFRGKLDISLSDRANLLLIADYSEQERNCCATTVRNVGTVPQFLPLLGFDLTSLELGDDNNEVLLGSDTISDTDQGGLSAELAIDFDNWSLTSVTAYREWTHDAEQDVDNLPFTEPTYGRLLITSNGGTTEQDQISQELRLTSTGFEDIDITAGLFLWRQDISRYFQREIQICGAPGFDPMLPPDTSCAFGLTQFGFFDTDLTFDNSAIFGQVDWHTSDALTLTAGLRLTRDELDFDFDRPTDPIAFPDVPPLTTSGGDDDTDLSGKLAAKWRIGDAASAYVSYTRGYKAQGFDIIFGLTPDRARPVDPETSDSFEAGYRAELFDRRLRLGVTAFHTTYDDYQGQAFDADQGAFILTSAGSVVTRGVEIDFTAKPIPNLLLNGGVSFTDAYYDEFENGPCWTRQTEAQGCIAGIQDLTDEDVPNSPDVKVTLQGRYDVALDAPVNLYLAGAYRWQDDAVSAVNQRPSLDIDSYSVLDLSVGVVSQDSNWEASIFIKNVLDDDYTNVLFESVFDAGDGTSQFLNRDFERYIGGTFTYRFY